MKVFITGGTGFVGTHLVKQLKSEGHEVLALARSEQSAGKLEALGVATVLGSLEDISSWEQALRAVDVVIHCAAFIGVWGEWQHFYTQITEVTRALLAAADRHQVGRFIYISSESVMQDREPLLNVDETYPCPAKPNSFYGHAKLLAEQAILQYEGSMTSLILRPTFIYGPGDSFSEDLKRMVSQGKFVWLDQGTCLIERVHVLNVVTAIMLSMSNGKHQGIYLITDGAPAPAHEVLTEIAQQAHIKLPDKSIPGSIARLAASGIEAIWRTLRLSSPPPLTRFEVAFMAMPRSYNISKARRELGYQPVKYS